MFTIHNADSLDLLKTLPDHSVHAVVTDPPYGLGDMSPARVAECLQAWARGDTWTPTGKGFMGKQWDAWVPPPELWREVLRVLKPGGHAIVFAGSRTQDLMSVSLRLAGFEVRDTLQWLYGSGFPKSLDVSKALDKQRYDRDQIREVTAWIRAKRDARGLRNADIDAAFGFNGTAGHWTAPASQPSAPTLDQVPKLLKVLGVAPEELPPRIAYLLEHLNTPKGQPAKTWHQREVIGARVVGPHWGEAFAHAKSKTSPHLQDITAPATDAARAWDGWGTALRPAYEPIILARKPLDGTAAQNTLTHGCGALNIDACRIGEEIMTASAMSSLGVMHDDKWTSKPIPPIEKAGRYPANILFDEAAAALLDAQTGTLRTGARAAKLYTSHEGTTYGEYKGGVERALPASEGGASRFFYTAKASRAEREAGLQGHETKTGAQLTGRQEGSVGLSAYAGTRGAIPRANVHPTVKPINLMRYLVRLVTPPHGTVLDPFTGSGSTGCAAVLERVNFVGIERENEYARIATARINYWATQAHADAPQADTRQADQPQADTPPADTPQANTPTVHKTPRGARRKAPAEDDPQGSLF